MGASLKQTMKNVVFLWGAISLGLIITVILYMMISNIRHHNKRPEKTEETLYEKTFGDVKIAVVGKYGNKEPEILISMARKNKKIFSNYLLPTHKKGFDYVRFYDSVVIPSGQNKYRIMLFTVADDCDNSSNQVWFLSFDGQMKFIRVDDLFEMHRSKSGEGPIYGNKHFSLPCIEGYENKQYVVPVEINAQRVITIIPLLNNRGVNLHHTDFEKDVAYIQNKLSKFPDQSKPEAARSRGFLSHELFRNIDVQQEFNEALKGNSISW